MKILNLHGLNGSAHNTNYQFLSKYYSGREDVEIISPQIDYASCSPYEVINILYDNIFADIVVGNSFGGFFAYVFSAISGQKALLINPCVPPHKYIGNLVPEYKYLDELTHIWEAVYKHKPSNYSLLLGDIDEVIDTITTLNTLNDCKDYTIISGGHSLKGEAYEKWFKEHLI